MRNTGLLRWTWSYGREEVSNSNNKAYELSAGNYNVKMRKHFVNKCTMTTPVFHYSKICTSLMKKPNENAFCLKRSCLGENYYSVSRIERTECWLWKKKVMQWWIKEREHVYVEAIASRLKKFFVFLIHLKTYLFSTSVTFFRNFRFATETIHIILKYYCNTLDRNILS